MMHNQDNIFNYTPSIEDIEKALAVKSMRDYIEYVWDILEPGTLFKSNWHIDAMCEHLEAALNNEIRHLLINMPPRHMKLIKDSQEIYTPDGWRVHGDLDIGDRVFSPSGKPIKVIGKSKKGPADCRVTFSNGEQIDCNQDHLWTFNDRPAGKIRTETTAYLLSRKLQNGKRNNFLIPNMQPLVFKESKQLLHPYFIGAWLGDGTAVKPLITSSPEDKVIIREINKRCGYRPTKRYKNINGNSSAYEFRCQGIIEKIRELQLYNNKHIPLEYKRASIEQRKQLIAGLIDTDGSLDKSGRVRIITINPILAEDIYEVCMSLGQRPYIMKGDAPGYADRPPSHPFVYVIGFQPTINFPCAVKRKRTNRLTKQRNIGITSIKLLENPEMGNCITVDSKDGLYLVGKTSIVTHNSLGTSVFFPSFSWIEDPYLQFLYSSYSQSLSTRDSVKTRRIIESQKYQGLIQYHQGAEENQEEYPDGPFKLTGDQNTKTKFENNYSGHRIATSVGGTATGDGGNYVVVDDAHNIKEAESKQVRDGVLTWWKEVMQSRLNDPSTGHFIACMQRSHEEDLSGYIIDNDKSEGEWTQLILPARYEGENRSKLTVPGFKDPRTEMDQPLWEDHYGDKQLTTLERALGTYASAGQLQQRPAPRSGGMFDRANWIIVPAINRQHIVDSVRYWDKAGTQDAGCYTAGLLMHKMIDESYLIEDVERGQWSYGKREQVIKNTAIRDGKNTQGWIEQEGGSGGKESAELTIKNLSGYNYRKESPTGDKVARANPFSAQVEISNVKLLKGEWNKAFIDECAMFPNGANKDQVDAGSGAFNKLALGADDVGAW